MSSKNFVAIICTLLFDITLIAAFISNLTRPKYWIPITGKIVGSATTSCGDSTFIVPALVYELNGISYNDLNKREYHIIKIFDGGDVDIFVNPKINSQYALKSETGIFKNVLLVPIFLLINATLISLLLHDQT
ncbi:hypothetical protein JCM2811A_32120 [Methylorubrum rhodinum]